jgi:hypothetical protein
MKTQHPPFLRRLRPTPLGACVAALYAIAAPAVLANTVIVSNCQDSGSGSLRAAIAGAADGGTADMTSLTCSPITLTTGELVINKSLVLNGPGADKLQISGNQTFRVINHLGTTLSINDLSIANGYVYSPSNVAAGGCIFSNGDLILTRAVVSGCLAQTDSGVAKGGGIYAAGTGSYMTSSRVSSNTAACAAGGTSGGTAEGGGFMFQNGFAARYSTISNNSVTCRTGGTAKAGAAYVPGGGKFHESTISNNSSSGDIGGIGGQGLGNLTVYESTISGNTAAGFFGGIVAAQTKTFLSHSTVAFNSAGAGSPSSGVYQAPGLHVAAGTLYLRSSLIANNTYGPAGKENDFSLQGPAAFGYINKNLVRVATSPLPTSTISGVCPLLGPLHDNGGPTQTHALLSHSPGIDAGNNTAPFSFDQRNAPYLRISGIAVDLGAYEVQQNDIVFNNSFDGCPAL